MGLFDAKRFDYWIRIYKIRFFWLHLVRWDMKFKFRRTRIGLLWTMLMPFLLTVLMGLVFGVIFKQDVLDYIPYILSGLLVWEILSASVIANGSAFLVAESYVRQYTNPSAIYTLRASLVTMCTFFIAGFSMFIWMAILRGPLIPLAVLTLPLTMLMYFLLCWGLSNIAAHVNIRFRDYPYVMQLVMQFVWYLSPVFFRPEMFMGSPILALFFNLNPITHILNIYREPFLYGRLASMRSYAYVSLLIVVVGCISMLVTRKYERDIIFCY